MGAAVVLFQTEGGWRRTVSGEYLRAVLCPLSSPCFAEASQGSLSPTFQLLNPVSYILSGSVFISVHQWLISPASLPASLRLRRAGGRLSVVSAFSVVKTSVFQLS